MDYNSLYQYSTRGNKMTATIHSIGNIVEYDPSNKFHVKELERLIKNFLDIRELDDEAVKYLTNPAAYFYEVNSKFVGCCIFRYNNQNTFYIRVFMIHHKFHRRGFGGGFLSDVIDLYRGNNQINAAQLATGLDNTPAINLYKKIGFNIKTIGIDEGRKFALMELLY